MKEENEPTDLSNSLFRADLAKRKNKKKKKKKEISMSLLLPTLHLYEVRCFLGYQLFLKFNYREQSM